MYDLLIKYPTRERPEIFKNILTKYIEKLSGKYNIKFIISLDDNDASCNNPQIKSFLNNIKSKVNLDYFYGISHSKIDACNRDIPENGWNICMLISDDMIPKSNSYDDIIINDMNRYFPDFDGCLNYNVHNTAFTQHIPGRGSLMPLSIEGNTYYKRFNYIYNPVYKSLFSDDEQTRVARKMNKIVDINNNIISHNWSDITDDMRRRTEMLDPEDRKTFKERLNAGLI